MMVFIDSPELAMKPRSRCSQSMMVASGPSADWMVMDLPSGLRLRLPVHLCTSREGPSSTSPLLAWLTAA